MDAGIRRLALGSLVVVACGPTTPIVIMHGDADTGADPGPANVDTGPVVTTLPPPDPGTTGGDDLDPMTTMGVTGITTTPPPVDSSDGDGGLPDGSQCAEDEDCASGQCDLAGVLGGICGECNEDADCVDGGCTPSNPLTSEPSYCNDGSTGEGCETDDACAFGLQCAVILDLPGIVTRRTCGDCLTDRNCLGGATCQPDYDIENLSGTWRCAPFNTQDNGEGCDLDNPDLACASGHCVEANFMELLFLGVCSECAGPMDCPAGECQPPEVLLDRGLIPGTCQ